MLLTLLYDVLIGAQVSLARQVLEKMRDEIDRERLITEPAIKERLQCLQLMLQDGELREDEYETLEAALIERLRAAREYANQRR